MNHSKRKTQTQTPNAPWPVRSEMEGPCEPRRRRLLRCDSALARTVRCAHRVRWKQIDVVEDKKVKIVRVRDALINVSRGETAGETSGKNEAGVEERAPVEATAILRLVEDKNACAREPPYFFSRNQRW